MIFLNPPPSWAEEENWIMSVQKEELSTFKHRNGYGPGGINVDLIAAILDEIGVDLTFKDYPIDVGREVWRPLLFRQCGRAPT